MGATISGQKVVTTAGTAVALGTGRVDGPIIVKALPANAGLVYIGGVNGDVTSSNGMPLAAGNLVLFENVGDLADVWVDAAVNGEGVSWLSLRV
jgi:hypothetical protein